MKKIIKPGKKTFKTICPQCACEFSYELEDLRFGNLNCPDCGGLMMHLDQSREIKEDEMMALLAGEDKKADIKRLEEIGNLSPDYCSDCEEAK